jgi:hypothetical protein
MTDLHITEISYRVHITNQQDRKELIDEFRKAIIKHKESQGVQDYAPGPLLTGWFIPYKVKAGVSYNKDYKFLKLKCSNPEDFKSLKEIKFIEHKGTVARIIPQVPAGTLEKLFTTPEHNILLQNIPADWTH